MGSAKLEVLSTTTTSPPNHRLSIASPRHSTNSSVHTHPSTQFIRHHSPPTVTALPRPFILVLHTSTIPTPCTTRTSHVAWSRVSTQRGQKKASGMTAPQYCVLFFAVNSATRHSAQYGVRVHATLTRHWHLCGLEGQLWWLAQPWLPMQPGGDTAQSSSSKSHMHAPHSVAVHGPGARGQSAFAMVRNSPPAGRTNPACFPVGDTPTNRRCTIGVPESVPRCGTTVSLKQSSHKSGVVVGGGSGRG